MSCLQLLVIWENGRSVFTFWAIGTYLIFITLIFFSNQENVKRMFIRDSVWDAMVFRALMHPSPYCCTYFNADSDNGQLLIHVMMPKAFLSFTFFDALHCSLDTKYDKAISHVCFFLMWPFKTSIGTLNAYHWQQRFIVGNE